MCPGGRELQQHGELRWKARAEDVDTCKAQGRGTWVGSRGRLDVRRASTSLGKRDGWGHPGVGGGVMEKVAVENGDTLFWGIVYGEGGPSL